MFSSALPMVKPLSLKSLKDVRGYCKRLCRTGLASLVRRNGGIWLQADITALASELIVGNDGETYCAADMAQLNAISPASTLLFNTKSGKSVTLAELHAALRQKDQSVIQDCIHNKPLAEALMSYDLITGLFLKSPECDLMNMPLLLPLISRHEDKMESYMLVKFMHDHHHAHPYTGQKLRYNQLLVNQALRQLIAVELDCRYNYMCLCLRGEISNGQLKYARLKDRDDLECGYVTMESEMAQREIWPYCKEQEEYTAILGKYPDLSRLDDPHVIELYARERLDAWSRYNESWGRFICQSLLDIIMMTHSSRGSVYCAFGLSAVLMLWLPLAVSFAMVYSVALSIYPFAYYYDYLARKSLPSSDCQRDLMRIQSFHEQVLPYLKHINRELQAIQQRLAMRDNQVRLSQTGAALFHQPAAISGSHIIEDIAGEVVLFKR